MSRNLRKHEFFERAVSRSPEPARWQKWKWCPATGRLTYEVKADSIGPGRTFVARQYVGEHCVITANSNLITRVGLSLIDRHDSSLVKIHTNKVWHDSCHYIQGRAASMGLLTSAMTHELMWDYVITKLAHERALLKLEIIEHLHNLFGSCTPPTPQGGDIESVASTLIAASADRQMVDGIIDAINAAQKCMLSRNTSAMQLRELCRPGVWSKTDRCIATPYGGSLVIDNPLLLLPAWPDLAKFFASQNLPTPAPYGIEFTEENMPALAAIHERVLADFDDIDGWLNRYLERVGASKPITNTTTPYYA